jgi:hypothetical protein
MTRNRTCGTFIDPVRLSDVNSGQQYTKQKNVLGDFAYIFFG